MPSVNVPNEFAADSEGLFQLDGMDENPPTTFQSEDETDTEGICYWIKILIKPLRYALINQNIMYIHIFKFSILAESGSHDEGINISRVQSGVTNLAKSLPVSVPVFPGAHNHENDVEEDDLVSVISYLSCLNGHPKFLILK